MLSPSAERRQLLQNALELVDEQERESITTLVTEFYKNVLTPDLRSRSAQGLLDAAVSHAELAELRTESQTLVRVLAPARPADDSSSTGIGHSIIQIVTDDMPFLVDSVTQAVTKAGYASHVLIHPQLNTLRPDDGTGLEVAAAPRPGTARESWMRLEIDSIESEAGRTELTEVIDTVLTHVRAAATDRESMGSQARQLAQTLRGSPPAGQPQQHVDNAADVLNWLSDGWFIFMGYRRYEMSTQGGDVLLHPLAETGLGLLATDHVDSRDRALGGRSAQRAGLPQLLTVTKANRRGPGARARPPRLHRNQNIQFRGCSNR